MKTKLLIGLLFVLCWTQNLVAQDSWMAAGAYYCSKPIQMSYSIGQVFYHQYTLDNLTLTEGVQQGYEEGKVDLIPSMQSVSGLRTFPNPVTNNLTLLSRGAERDLRQFYQLYDIQGLLLMGGTLCGKITHIDFGHYPEGVYILQITDSHNMSQIIKILKE